MDVQEIILGVQPLVGDVRPIRTVQETQPVEDYGYAYVAEVNVKSAAKVVKVLDASIARDPTRTTSHLRRFAKQSNLPEHLHPLLLGDKPSPQSIFVLIPPPLPEVDLLQELLAPFAVTPATPSTAQPQTPSESQPEFKSPPKVPLHTIKVPTLPPLSAQQADTWTKTLWPVVYNPAAARATVAPPVQVLARTREFIQPDAGKYLALARKVAHEALNSGRGRGVGAVVVDPEIVERILDAGGDMEERWADAIVAVAGDARYSRREAGKPSVAEKHSGPGPNPAVEGYDADVEGGPDLHALMRAAEIIAYKRRVGDPDAESDRPDLSPMEEYFIAQLDSTAPEPKQDTDTDTPTPVPEKYQKTGLHESLAVPIKSTSTSAPQESSTPGASLRIRPRAQGGYLCTDLDVYLTHEPCVCCCMALLLSRFRSVTYPQTGRMVSGGLASEPVIKPVPVSDPDSETGKEEGAANEANSKQSRQYYGLHWRKELNWRALGFEFVQGGPNEDEEVAEYGVAFYA
ncbi:hypothetical protein ASPCAL08083 [Aspergillus calidoustus]|uniref:tRNA-specific adenosine-34 deaminase subunit Tad3 n=1 Tax=Aspergillus calidoustus TaxID=454130 RepID=A0A0U5GP97_ASPCI|nr:hypothetical protein ASPCAL08083 [Aspergillus calidoustus]